ncbi:MAG: FAD-binding oxidoreductase, partial [Burkholderiaceae bacterium]|nr:FAD-binding oxidoreductase [Burkholderiaceae bacterium]
MSPLPPSSIHSADYLVIGAGIAGASAAYWLAPHGHVVVLERESQPGYHSTGRSAALFVASYGTPQVRALTRASQAFFDRPPAGFAGQPLLTPRGTLTVAAPGQEAALDDYQRMLQADATPASRLTGEQARALVPVLRPERVVGAIHEPEPADMDVHAIHQGYLRGLRGTGGKLVCDAEVQVIERASGAVNGDWRVCAGGQWYQAPVVLNAAGAWADQVARLAAVPPLGLQARRRSAFTFAPPQDLAAAIADWPMVGSVTEDWYFKPEAGMLLASPANADPVAPQDVQPEALDIALAIDRIE